VAVDRAGHTGAAGGKKHAILEAALAVIAEKGYHQATIDEIAARAGVGKGTVYVYFKSKSALVRELVDTITRAHLKEMEQRISRVEGAKEKLLLLAGAEFDFWRRHAPLARMLAGEPLGMAPELQDQMRAARQRYVKLIQAVIEEGQRQGVFIPSIDPLLAATIIFGARMAILQYATELACTDCLDRHAEAVRAQTVDFFLRALARPGSAR